MSEKNPISGYSSTTEFVHGDKYAGKGNSAVNMSTAGNECWERVR